jgi:hypothetical protein
MFRNREKGIPEESLPHNKEQWPKYEHNGWITHGIGAATWRGEERKG